MNNLGLAYLYGKNIKSISNLIVIEDSTEYLPSDTFILETDKGDLIQVLIDYEVLVYNLQAKEKIIVLGEYNKKRCEVLIKKIKEFKTQTIHSIYNYKHKQHYNFGSKFLNETGDFIFGFCYGFDEIILLNENDFDSMLINYTEVTEELI